MMLVYDHKDPMIRFGAGHIKKSLERRGDYFIERFAESGSRLPIAGIAVERLKTARGQRPAYKDQAFGIRHNGDRIVIEGSDSRGVMYGTGFIFRTFTGTSS